jgi:hypothetical protein
MSMIPVLPDPIRRDHWGRYKVLPPEGKKPVGYARATTVAKALDDTSNLAAWGKRMTALGLAVRPDLLAMIQTTDNTDKKALDRLCESASEAGGATARRDLGTALHKMFEQSCVLPGYQPPPAYVADIYAIHTALREAGLQVVDECSELMVVLDRYQIAGMADLIVERISDGELFIADLKTGSSVAYGALGWAIQLAIYANADNIYIQGTEADGSYDVRAPMPAVNKQQAFIIHCQPESGACDLHTLDIGKGFEALETAISVREWRKQRKLLLPFEGTSGVESRSMVALDGPAAGSITPEPVAATPVAEHITAVESALVERDHMIMLRTLWLLDRIRLLGIAGHIEQVQQWWPQGTAGPKAVRSQESAWSIADIAAVIRCVDGVEAANDIPFGATDPELAHTMAVAHTQQLLDHIAGAEPRRGAPAPLKGGSPP